VLENFTAKSGIVIDLDHERNRPPRRVAGVDAPWIGRHAFIVVPSSNNPGFPMANPSTSAPVDNTAVANLNEKCLQILAPPQILA
jgi:hypothetical protein